MKNLKSYLAFYLLIVATIFAIGCLAGVLITPISASCNCYEAENEGLTNANDCNANITDVLYDYAELTVCAEYSDEYRVCKVAAGEYDSGTYLEISGVGLYQIRESADVIPGNIVIFFNNVEDVDEFNKKIVKARVCSDEV